MTPDSSLSPQIPTKILTKRLLSYIKPYRMGFVFAILGMIVYAGIDTYFIANIKIFVDEGLNKKNHDLLFMMGIAVPFIFIGRGIANFIATYSLSWVGGHVVADLRQQMFEHMMKLPVQFHDQTSTGELISKITYDISQIQEASSKAILTLIREGAFVVGIIFVMFYYSWQLSLIFLLISPIVALIVSYVSKRFRKVSKRMQKAVGGVTTISEQMLNGHKVVVMNNAQQLEAEKFLGINKTTRQQQIKMASTTAISVSVIQVIASLALATVLIVASAPEFLATISVGTFTSIVTFMLMLLRPLKQLTTVNSQFQRGMAACASVFELLDQSVEKDQGKLEIERVKGDIVFKNMTFTYSTKEDAALNQINLSIPAGKTFALVGRSGSGKSTLANLLTRFYEHNHGDILLDGHPIQTFTLANLRSHFALVSQQVILFNDSIRNNIAYGIKGVSDAEIEAAAEAAYVMDFANAMPDGLDTQIGESGVSLSGGQRQRVTIARAILKNAPVLILDEATSALDTESERRIQMALDDLSENRTVIVIAHRLSTIENADQIIVMDQGAIKEQGAHQQLLDQNGLYAQIYNMQFTAQPDLQNTSPDDSAQPEVRF